MDVRVNRIGPTGVIHRAAQFECQCSRASRSSEPPGPVIFSNPAVMVLVVAQTSDTASIRCSLTSRSFRLVTVPILNGRTGVPAQTCAMSSLRSSAGMVVPGLSAEPLGFTGDCGSTACGAELPAGVAAAVGAAGAGWLGAVGAGGASEVTAECAVGVVAAMAGICPPTNASGSITVSAGNDFLNSTDIGIPFVVWLGQDRCDRTVVQKQRQGRLVRTGDR